MIMYTIANILLHVILISSFLVIFFFTYASKVEKQIVERQSTALVKDVIQSTTEIFPEIAMKEINTQFIENLKAPEMAAVDAEIEASNKALFDKTIKIIVVVFILGIIIVYIMSRVYNFSMSEIIIHNVIILVFVGLTEFLFLTHIAKNYDTIDSNFVKYKILETINNRL